MTVTLERLIICRALISPLATVRSQRQLPPPLLPLQLRSSGGRLSGVRRHNPPPRPGPRSPRVAGRKPPEDTLPAPPGGFSDPELHEKTRESMYCELAKWTHYWLREWNVSHSETNQLCVSLRWLALQGLSPCETVMTDRLWTSCRLPYKTQGNIPKCSTGSLLPPAGHHAFLQQDVVCKCVCAHIKVLYILYLCMQLHLWASTYACIMVGVCVCVCVCVGANRWCEEGNKNVGIDGGSLRSSSQSQSITSPNLFK